MLAENIYTSEVENLGTDFIFDNFSRRNMDITMAFQNLWLE
ncbi:unnamed protein product [Camellia sinensis]